MAMRRPRGLTRKLPPVEALHLAAAREFRGGLNTFDTPLNLSSRYLIEAVNVYPDTNGRLRLRYGTSLFSSVLDADEILGVEYFGTALVAVARNGRVYTINGAGTVTTRFNTAIAAALPGAPAAWSTGLSFVSFTQFAGTLIICNGVDKPLQMSKTLAVTYLQDAGTASNVNTPRAKFCMTHNNYLILAVTPTDATTLYIGEKGTAGTFVGDPGIDNDAINYSVATRIDIGSPDITGLASFRDKLIVTFDQGILSLVLGVYNSSNVHVPTVSDTIENHGSVSHHCIVPLGEDLLFMDKAGMSTVQRAVLTNALSPVRESTLIATDVQSALANLTATQLQENTFAVHDRASDNVMMFIPQSVPALPTTDNDVFVYCYNKPQKLRAWSYFTNMTFRCGCRTGEDRVFLCSGINVFLYHNKYDPLYTDFSGPGSEPWSDDTLFTDGTGWYSTDVGAPISFSFALPWTDMHAAYHVKQSKYADVTAEGDGTFTLQMFVDNFSTAELEQTFSMTSEPSSGTAISNPNNNSQLYAWPQKFSSMRMRIEGTARAYIGFVAIVVHYLKGSIRR